MRKILFVCLGNICRSPMAEAIFTHKLEKKGLDQTWAGDSAGTAAYHIGNQPDPRTLKTLLDHNIPFRHAARQAKSKDAEEFDYIFAMDAANYSDLESILPTDYQGLRLMRSYDEQAPNADVPDPYYGGQNGFEEVYEMLDRSIEAMIDDLIAQS